MRPCFLLEWSPTRARFCHVQEWSPFGPLCIVLPSVAQDCPVRVEPTEKHNGAARAVEGHCMREARHWTDVLYLSPVCAVETPAIAEKAVEATATEQHNRAGRCRHRHAFARGRSEPRYLNPARTVPRPSRNGATIEQEHSAACAVKGHCASPAVRRSRVCLLGPILAVELPGLRSGRRGAASK